MTKPSIESSVRSANRMQLQVSEFHHALGATIGDVPALRDGELRARIIAEELDEVAESLSAGDFANLIKEICDLLYVVYGTGVAFGVTLHSRLDKPRSEFASPPRLVLTSLAQRRLYAGGQQTVRAIESGSLPHAIRAMQHLLNVIELWLWRWHVPLQPFFEMVHQSNMAKLGGPVRADGKILKPAGWQAPAISALLAELSAGKELGS